MAVGQNPQGNYCYVYYFPLKDTQWHKLTISWDDLVPEDQCYPIGTYGALPPSGIMTIRFGTRWTIWHNNAPISEHQYCIDQIQIEEKVEKPGPAPALRPFSEIQDLFRAKKPVHIVCMGDSITAGTALMDKEKERYAVLLQDLLRKKLGYGQIFCESRAVGGARLTDARAWVPRDFVGDPPDLVTILYGYNDKSSAQTNAYFKDSLNDYLDRIARKTAGKTAVLLLPTIPGMGPRFVMMDDFADAVRETAQARGIACFDLQKVFKAIGREKINDLLADMAHPNAEGHRLIADSLANFLH
jgi:lysophospholipase L1-like esterase